MDEDIPEAERSGTGWTSDDDNDLLARYQGWVYLRRIRFEGGSFRLGDGFGTRLSDLKKDPQRIAEHETKAFQEIVKLRAAKTVAEEAKAFPAVVASTATPSAIFLIEAQDLMRRPGLRDDDRVNLSEGALRLALRPDIPLDLRWEAKGLISVTLQGFVDHAKCHAQCGRVTGTLLDAFHDSVIGPKRDLDYTSFLFNSLLGQWLSPQIVGWVPKLRERLPAFASDAAVYEQQLEDAGRKPDADMVRKRTSQEIDYFSKHPAGKK